MASESEQRRFRNTLNRLLEKSFNIELPAIRRIKSLLRDVRKSISEIITFRDFDQFALSDIQKQVRREFAVFGDEADAFLRNELIDVVDKGNDIFEMPFKSVGAEILVTTLPGVRQEVLTAQQARGTQFIANLSEEASNRINTEIRLAINGGQSTTQAMRRIGNIGIKRSTFNSVADRAEAIVRTEINTALNTVSTNRLDAISGIGGMRKFWMTAMDNRVRASHIAVGMQTNPARGGNPIPVKQDFVLIGSRGAERAKGPHDSRLSAANVVQCRCRVGFMITKKTNLTVGVLQ